VDFGRLILFAKTISFLKPKQVYYRLYYLIKKRLPRKTYFVSESKLYITFLNFYDYENSGIKYYKNEFTFLNKTKKFTGEIDWNFSDYGKLWNYNLNYFDFLNNSDVSKETGLYLIKNHISIHKSLKDGLQSYPISLRSINWIKFVSKHKIDNPEINKTLLSDYYRLMDNLEYDLMGNHLLENGFSILFGSYYFKNESFYKKALKLIKQQLEEQILSDGCHFELSPMYHQIILYRLMECIYLIKNNTWGKEEEFLVFLVKKAEKMLSFLYTITYNDGNIPMFNDSAYDIAPLSLDLFQFAEKLDLHFDQIELTESGYRKVKTSEYELFIDFGKIGPSYQAGHAHADMLSFELKVNNNPFIVDRGVSTYESNNLRQEERSTVSHNTVAVLNKNQSEVWGGFRVAKRAKIIQFSHVNNVLTSVHNGFKDLVGNHKREFIYSENRIVIKDSLSKTNQIQATANFHFHPSIKIISVSTCKICFSNGAEISYNSLKHPIKITTKSYKLAQGFNKTVSASMASVTFNHQLTTEIKL